MSLPDDTDRWSDDELIAVFNRLFPRGFAGDDVLAELAPNGWDQCPLIAAYHPKPEQVYDEAVRMHHNLLSLRRPDDERPLPQEPTLQEIVAGYVERPVEPHREVRELLGACLWDVFSNNHDVIGPDGRSLDLGSFRASGGFLADLLNDQIGTSEYDYMSFYMGTIWIAQRADLGPVYQMIFRRLKREQLDWAYHFPRLYAIDMRPLRRSLAKPEENEWETYDPGAAIEQEQADRKKDGEIADLRETLDAGYRDSVAAALEQPPPPVVLAYRVVYGGFPKGWPPEIEAT